MKIFTLFFINLTGHYLYTEASRKRENEVAMLKSYAVLPSDYCFDFNFHMKGVRINNQLNQIPFNFQVFSITRKIWGN